MLAGEFGELHAHGGGDVDHARALRLEADLLEQRADVVDALARVEISLQKMAAALQAAGDQHAVGAVLEGMQHVHDVDAAGAGQLDDLDRARIGLAIAAGEIGRGIGAMPATEGDDLRMKAAFGRGR